MTISRWLRKNNEAGEKRHLRPSIYQLTHRRTDARFGYYILLAVVIAAGYAVLFSTLLDIKTIIIEGNSSIAKEDIIEAIQRTKEKRRWLIFSQRNILFFNAETAQENLNSPRLKNIRVERQFLNTIIVKVAEKQAVALWQNRNRWYEIDQLGTVIGEINSQTIGQPSEVLALVDSSAVKDIIIGERVMPSDILLLIQRIHREWPSNLGVYFKLYDINKIGEEQITVRTKEGWQIYFSAVTDIGAQLRKLEIFVLDKDKNDDGWRKGIEYIDLRFGTTRVYYK